MLCAPAFARVALVTGGNRGIGRAIAQQLAAGGDSVVVGYKADARAADECVASLAPPPAGAPAHFALQADVADPDACARLIAECVGRCGALDVLVLNAGVIAPTPLFETDYERWVASWRETLATNLVGPACLCYHAARHMAARGAGGAMVFVGSRGGFRGEPEAFAYGASKLGLNNLVGSLAVALGPHGVRVSGVAPGFIETDMAADVLATPGVGDAIRAQSAWARVGTPAEVAHVVAFLASEGATWATGAIVDCNGASYLRL